jgi:palmitoyltransferase ZDHHC9/14/18
MLIQVLQTTYENFRYHYYLRTNPYNRGLVQNFIESLCSRIPSSKNNFRAKAKEDSAAFTSSRSMGRVRNPPKMSVDLEMGIKRQAVGVEDMEDILPLSFFYPTF